MASREDLIALMELHIGIENTKVISEAVLDFVKWYDDQQVCVKVPFTIRDLVAWMTFIKDSWLFPFSRLFIIFFLVSM